MVRLQARWLQSVSSAELAKVMCVAAVSHHAGFREPARRHACAALCGEDPRTAARLFVRGLAAPGGHAVGRPVATHAWQDRAQPRLAAAAGAAVREGRRLRLLADGAAGPMLGPTVAALNPQDASDPHANHAPGAGLAEPEMAVSGLLPASALCGGLTVRKWALLNVGPAIDFHSAVLGGRFKYTLRSPALHTCFRSGVPRQSLRTTLLSRWRHRWLELCPHTCVDQVAHRLNTALQYLPGCTLMRLMRLRTAKHARLSCRQLVSCARPHASGLF